MTAAPVDQPDEEKLALRYIDTHCHLDDPIFDGEVDAVISESMANGVTSFVNVGFNLDTWGSTIELARKFATVSIALGLHPQDADYWNPETADALRKNLKENRLVAIGEIGIDLFRGETNLPKQRSVFDDQLDLALEHNLPVIIHMRSAQIEVLNLLRSRSSNPTLLFHSFDGTEELTSYALETGSMVGVGGLATRAKSMTIREQLQSLPLDQMVLETDSPYLLPAKLRGSRNTPQSIPVIASFLSNLKEVPLQLVAETTTANAERIFGELEPS